jgi:hypothetical protein
MLGKANTTGMTGVDAMLLFLWFGVFDFQRSWTDQNCFVMEGSRHCSWFQLDVISRMPVFTLDDAELASVFPGLGTWTELLGCRSGQERICEKGCKYRL